MRGFLVGLMLFPSLAFAQVATVTTLKKGDIAPFDGSLLNPQAVAQILADKEYAKKQCDLDSAFALAKLQMRFDKESAELRLTNEILSKKYDTVVALKDAELSRVYDTVIKAEKSSSYKWLYFIGGAALGVGLSIGTAYAVSHAVR
jgi:hypothetical protein